MMQHDNDKKPGAFYGIEQAKNHTDGQRQP